MTLEAAAPIARPSSIRRAQADPAWVRYLLTGLTVLVIGFLIVIPLVNVFVEALAGGFAAYVRRLVFDPETRHAIGLTLTVVPLALALNVVFGLCAAWALTRFRFPGRALLSSLIDLPFAVSPVVAGLMFVLIFGLQGHLGPLMRQRGLELVPYLIAAVAALLTALVYFAFRPASESRRRGLWRRPLVSVGLGSGGVFVLTLALGRALGLWPETGRLDVLYATPGLVLATAFVTFPFVAKELIPVMEAVGADEELAALSLGANGWQMFWYVTLPNVKWGLAYGVILCAARALGEFGAVYVVSGRISGLTDTLPLRIEKLYQEYDMPGAFAVASLLSLLSIVTLIMKAKLEQKVESGTRSRKA